MASTNALQGFSSEVQSSASTWNGVKNCFARPFKWRASSAPTWNSVKNCFGSSAKSMKSNASTWNGVKNYFARPLSLTWHRQKEWELRKKRHFLCQTNTFEVILYVFCVQFMHFNTIVKNHVFLTVTCWIAAFLRQLLCLQASNLRGSIFQKPAVLRQMNSAGPFRTRSGVRPKGPAGQREP